MRLVPLSAFLLASAFAVTAFAQEAPDGTGGGEREGPFVMTDKTLGGLLEDGFDIKGILGGSMILVRGAELYSCGLTPDSETLTYKTHFACSRLDEIAPAQ